MDVNVYGDAVVRSTCQMLSRKSTDSEKVLWWCRWHRCRWHQFCGRTDLVVVRGNLTAAGHIEQILRQHVLVAAYGVGPQFVLMHDNARAHVACITRVVLQELDRQQWFPTLIPLSMCGIGITEVFMGILFLHRLSKTSNRLLLKNRTWYHNVSSVDLYVYGCSVPPQTLQNFKQVLIEEWNLILKRDLRRLIWSMPCRCQAAMNALEDIHHTKALQLR